LATWAGTTSKTKAKSKKAEKIEGFVLGKVLC